MGSLTVDVLKMQNHFKHKGGQLTALFLLLIFMGPLIAAHVMFAYRDKIHFKTTQIGTLCSPAISTQNLAFAKTSTASLGKWQLIYISNDATETAVEDSPMWPILKQIHLALGKEKHRVRVNIVDSKDIPVLKAGQLAIIDPKGFIVLYYSEDCHPPGILKDLRQLLRVSHA